MRREYAQTFWRRYLSLVCNDAASMSVENPALDFTVREKAGEYNDIPDEEYNQMVTDVEEVQPIWNNQKSQAASKVLINALCKTDIPEQTIESISDLLAECSERSVYLPEQMNSAHEPKDREPRRCPDIGREIARQGELHCTPRSIYKCIDEHVLGQEAAKRAAALIYYNMIGGRRSNTIFCGPTGCGKSEIWRFMAKLFPQRIRMIDASRMSADGWKGSVHLRDIFEGVEPADLEDGIIVVLDEADKICCEAALSSNGMNYNVLVQNSLLKMLDGDMLEFGKEDGRKAFHVDCSRVSVVLLGAFETLLRKKSRKCSGGIGFGAVARVDFDYTNTEITYDDLIHAGMRREIAGRVNRIVPLRALDVDDYRAILMGPVMKELREAVPAKLEIDEETIDYLAEQAEETGLGVRWMKSQIMNAIDNLIFDDPSAPLCRLSLHPHAAAHE